MSVVLLSIQPPCLHVGVLGAEPDVDGVGCERGRGVRAHSGGPQRHMKANRKSCGKLWGSDLVVFEVWSTGNHTLQVVSPGETACFACVPPLVVASGGWGMAGLPAVCTWGSAMCPPD